MWVVSRVRMRSLRMLSYHAIVYIDYWSVILIVIFDNLTCATILQLATRMATQFGTLGEFRPETESILLYLDSERADIFFTANGVANNKKVAVFLSSVGGKTYSLLCDLLAPEKPQEHAMDTLSTTLKDHFQPEPLVISERFYFHSWSQGPTETIAQYMAELRWMATHCDFGAYLNDALRDRLVCGLSNANIQKRLCRKIV